MLNIFPRDDRIEVRGTIEHNLDLKTVAEYLKTELHKHPEKEDEWYVFAELTVTNAPVHGFVEIRIGTYVSFYVDVPLKNKAEQEAIARLSQELEKY